GGRLDDRVVGVPDRGDADAAAHVDDVVAVDVDEDRAVRPLDVHRQHAVHAGGHHGPAPLVDLAAARAGDLGDDAGFLGDLGGGAHGESLPPHPARGIGFRLVAWAARTSTGSASSGSATAAPARAATAIT